MSGYNDLIDALRGTTQIWIEVEGPLVDGVRLTQDFLLPDNARAPLAAALSVVPAPPAPPPVMPDEDMIVTGLINVRPLPNQTRPYIGQLQKGDRVTVNDTFHDAVSGIDYTLLKSVNGLKQQFQAFVGRKWLTPAVPTPVPEPSPQPPAPPAVEVVTRWTTASAGLKQHTLPDVDSPQGAGLLPLHTKVSVDGNSITNGYLQRVDNKLWLAAKYLTAVDPATTPLPGAPIWGVNLDPQNLGGNPSALSCDWVRFSFRSYSRTLAEAFAIFDPIIARYRAMGIRILLILSQETTSIEQLPGYAGQIAAHYAGKGIGYEIWNEEDQASASAVGLEPEVFGKLLSLCALNIHHSDPAAKVVIGGLASGDPVGYLKASGVDGADGIGLHPYTKSVPQMLEYLKAVHSVFPDLTLWITEYSWPGNDATMADYIRSSFAAVSVLPYVETLIWFCWSDAMVEGFGIMDKAGHPKPLVYEAYLENCTKPANIPAEPKTPEPVPWSPVRYPRHTLHYMAGGNWNNVASWLQQRKSIGKPVPGLLLCSMNWSGEPTPEQAIAAGAMEVIWRDYPGGSTWSNWSDEKSSYQAGYNHVMRCRLPEGSLDNTFIQIQNEPTSVGPGFASFYEGAFDAAKQRVHKIKIAYPAFSVGFPPLDFWPGFVNVLRRGRDEGHRFMLHQYRAFWDQDGEVGTDKQTFINTLLNPEICLRHQKIFAILPDDLKHMPVVMGEFFSRVATRIPLDWYRDGIQALNIALALDPNLAWAAHWTYGHGGDSDWEVSEVYDEKAAALFEA